MPSGRAKAETAPRAQPGAAGGPDPVDLIYRPDGINLQLFYKGAVVGPDGVVKPAPRHTYLDERTGLELPLPNVDFILGPISSGKTRCMFERLLRHIQEAYPCRDGIRRTRWAIVRNTYPQIDLTTKPDFDDIFARPFKEGYYGTWKKTTPSIFTFKFDDVEAECIFLAFEDMEAVGQAKSAQWTGVLFHELRYLQRAVVGNLIERAGRYPAKEEIAHNFDEGTPHEQMAPQWFGALGDSNMPDNQHWLSTMAGKEPVPAWVHPDERDAWTKPHNWNIYVQPPGLVRERDATGKLIGYKPNPRAENQKHMVGGAAYYMSKIKEGRAYVDSQIMNEPAPDRSGAPVHPDYNDAAHYAAAPIPVQDGVPIIVGVDFGNCFAAELAQNISSAWSFFDELYLPGVSTEAAAEELRARLSQRYPEHLRDNLIQIWCGDDGSWRNSHSRDLESHIQIFKRAAGLIARVAPTQGNRLTVRVAAMDAVLRRFPMGRPGIMISSDNPMLRTGLQSGYIWKQLKDGTRLKDVEKSDYSHPVEAAHHALLGGGEGRSALGQSNRLRVVHTVANHDPFDRGPDPFDRGRAPDPIDAYR